MSREILVGIGAISVSSDERASFRVQNGKIVLRWCCPVCGTIQDTVVDLNDLAQINFELVCQSPQCNKALMSLQIEMTIGGWCKASGIDGSRLHDPILIEPA